MAKETFPQRLYRLRTEAGLTQRQLAEPGVSYAYISRLEAGRRQPSFKAIAKLAAKFNVTPLYLWLGDSEVCPCCFTIFPKALEPGEPIASRKAPPAEALA